MFFSFFISMIKASDADTHTTIKRIMKYFLLISFFIIFVQAGPDDTIEDLKVGLGNLGPNHLLL